MTEKSSRGSEGRFLSRKEGEFIGRASELKVLGEIAPLVSKGLSSVLLLFGLPGIGKSELLRRAADDWPDARKKVLSIHLPFPPGDPQEALSALARTLCLCLNERMGGDAPSGNYECGTEWVRNEAGAVGALLRHCIDTVDNGHLDAALHLIPRLAEEFARENRCKVVVFLDDVHRLTQPDRLVKILSSRCNSTEHDVSWVLAFQGCRALLEGVQGSSPLRSVLLGPLDEGDAEDLLALAMRKAGIALDRQCREGAALLGGIPFLIWQAASSASILDINSFNNMDSFIRFYAREQSSGFLYEYHKALLGQGTREVKGAESKASLEVLLHLFNRSGMPPDRRVIAREMLKDDQDLDPVFDGLMQRGLVDFRWGKVVVSAPDTMADFCRDQFRRYFEGCSEEESRSRLFLEKKSVLNRGIERKSSRKNTEELKLFLASWNGQLVPRSLFDFGRFQERCPKGALPSGEQLVSSDRSRIVLPHVVDVWNEEYPGNDRVPPYSIDLLSVAVPEKETMQRWLAVDVRIAQREVSADMVEDFERRCRLFQNRAGLKAGELTCWMIGGGSFSAQALERIRELKFWSSVPGQIQLMAKLLNYQETMQLCLPSEKRPEDEPYVFQMIIPARSETELVAAKALEQIGEGLPLKEEEIGKVKMALVEACLNAFEHGASEEKNVYLTFRVRSDRLEIDVFNKGRSFVPWKIAKPAIEEKVGAAYKRGWGLSIIDELMDELDFIEQESGTLLRMVKYFEETPREDADDR